MLFTPKGEFNNARPFNNSSAHYVKPPKTPMLRITQLLSHRFTLFTPRKHATNAREMEKPQAVTDVKAG